MSCFDSKALLSVLFLCCYFFISIWKVQIFIISLERLWFRAHLITKKKRPPTHVNNRIKLKRATKKYDESDRKQ